jgi:hypothetical protein
MAAIHYRIAHAKKIPEAADIRANTKIAPGQHQTAHEQNLNSDLK